MFIVVILVDIVISIIHFDSSLLEELLLIKFKGTTLFWVHYSNMAIFTISQKKKKEKKDFSVIWFEKIPQKTVVWSLNRYIMVNIASLF